MNPPETNDLSPPQKSRPPGRITAESAWISSVVFSFAAHLAFEVTTDPALSRVLFWVNLVCAYNFLFSSAAIRFTPLGKIDSQVRTVSNRVRLITGITVLTLLTAALFARETAKWEMLALGLAWRLLLVSYVLPWWLALKEYNRQHPHTKTPAISTESVMVKD